MALRFQQNDEIDEQVDKKPSFGRYLLYGFGIAVLFSGIEAVSTFISGGSLSAWRREALLESAFSIGIAIVMGLVVPGFDELRIRSKEIAGKVSAIEESINEIKIAQSEFVKKLAAIEDKTDL